MLLKNLLALLAAAWAAAPTPAPARPAGFGFDSGSGLTNRFLTPNGDGRNDFTVLRFSNPRASQVAGEVYDLKGAKVADMTAGPAADTLMWDGMSGGRPVAGGLYVYRLTAEDRAYTGVLVVVR